MDVVDEVLQSDLGPRSDDADCSYEATTRRGLLSAEHVLDTSANPALLSVGVLFPSVARSIGMWHAVVQCKTTVDLEVDAGYETAEAIRKKRHCHVCDLVWPADPAQRRRARVRFIQGGGVFRNHTWRDRIHANSGRAVIVGKLPAQRSQPGFCYRIMRRRPKARSPRVQRGDEQHPPANFICPHVLTDESPQAARRHHVDGDHPAPVLFRSANQRAAPVRWTRAMDQQRHLTEPLDSRFEDSLRGLLIAQIRRDKVRLPTDMPDFVGDGLTGFSSDVGDQEAGAFMR